MLDDVAGSHAWLRFQFVFGAENNGAGACSTLAILAGG
jgi:hypothetical protein